jgi:hypothetical protein
MNKLSVLLLLVIIELSYQLSGQSNCQLTPEAFEQKVKQP